MQTRGEDVGEPTMCSICVMSDEWKLYLIHCELNAVKSIWHLYFHKRHFEQTCCTNLMNIFISCLLYLRGRVGQMVLLFLPMRYVVCVCAIVRLCHIKWCWVWRCEYKITSKWITKTLFLVDFLFIRSKWEKSWGVCVSISLFRGSSAPHRYRISYVISNEWISMNLQTGNRTSTFPLPSFICCIKHFSIWDLCEWQTNRIPFNFVDSNYMFTFVICRIHFKTYNSE